LVTALSILVQRYNINIAVISLLVFMLGMYGILVYLRRHHLKLGSGTPSFLSSKTKAKEVVMKQGITVPNTVLVGGKPVHISEPQRELADPEDNSAAGSVLKLLYLQGSIKYILHARTALV
jgi:hypothetical protein